MKWEYAGLSNGATHWISDKGYHIWKIFGITYWQGPNRPSKKYPAFDYHNAKLAAEKDYHKAN